MSSLPSPDNTPFTRAFSPSAQSLTVLNAQYSENFSDARLGVAPGRSLAIVACMDSRMDVFALLGLCNGEAHVIRNAGGVITDDVIRSLCLSQMKMGTREIILVHHSDCGLENLDEAEFREELVEELGSAPEWDFGSFDDPYADVRTSVDKLRASPLLPYTEHISGFVYDVTTGRLDPVEPLN